MDTFIARIVEKRREQARIAAVAAVAAEKAATETYPKWEHRIAKRMAKYDLSIEDIARLLDITEAEAVEYVNS